MFCDSQSALSLAEDPRYHEMTKHIDIRLHFIRDVVAKESFKLYKINTEVNPVDMLN